MCLELASYLRPRVPLFNQPSSGAAEPVPPLRVTKKRDDGVSEVGRLIRLKEVFPGNEWKTLGGHGRRHDRLPHRKRLEDLEARPSADPQRHHVNGGFS